MKRTVVVILLAACAHPAAAPPPDRSAQLIEAVRADSIVTVRALLDADLSPDTLAPDGARPLTEAARNDRGDVLSVLLRAGARPDLADSAHQRAIDYAIALGYRRIATQLTVAAARNAGASPEALAWFDAVATGRPPKAWQRLLDGELASLGLALAVLQQREALVESLRHAAGIPNRTGYPPLAMAARFGDETAVTMLLGAGANPDAEAAGPMHPTALMEAARDGYVEIGRRLIRAGARVDHVDGRRETALMWAVRQGETAYAAMLLDAGASMTRENDDSDTAFDLARRMNHTDLIALLQRHLAARQRDHRIR